MAITIRRPAFYKTSAVKNKKFIGRMEPRKAFWNRYTKMISEGSTVITFYGAGGVGKSALLRKIEEEIKNRDKLTGNGKFVKYDFSTGTDMREVLKTLEVQLSNYGCEFPLFDTGNYYYLLKVGQNVTPLKATSALDKISWVQKMKKDLPKAENIAGTTKFTFGTTKKILNAVTDEDENFAEYFLKEASYILGESLPVMSTVTTVISVADKLLLKYMKSKEVFDAAHAEIREQLNDRCEEKNSVTLYEYLPMLFAQDVTDWMTATGNKLVVILDNYESLTGAISLATSEQSKRDSWLRELIFTMPDTLWTIAGRNKLCWDGELAKETEQHLITALSPEDSNNFLERAGIADENLRDGLVKLTEGHLLFLNLCVDVYVEYKSRNNAAPTIDEFGKKREEVVGRIFRYLDAAGDDAAKNMLEFLCLLNVWTDELVENIGGQILYDASRKTYRRVKNFSFIQSERVEDLTIYRFDKTIQKILVKTVNEKLTVDVTVAVDDYFKNLFADKEVFGAKEIFYLKLWAEFIICFADNETLRPKFASNDCVSALTNCVQSLGEDYFETKELLDLREKILND